MNNDFQFEDIINTLEVNNKINILPENIFEGDISYRQAKIRGRSDKLRNIAMEHFSHNGIIKCDCCHFETTAFYGEKYGKLSCIEMHHLKPIFLYNNNDIRLSIDKALANLLPVCPNCHRIIHKNHISEEILDDFKREILNTQIKWQR